MQFRNKFLTSAVALAGAMLCTAASAATFDEVDANGDSVLTEQEFIDALGGHHGPIAYRQYNTDAQPITLVTDEEVQATDPETGELLFNEDGTPLLEIITTETQIEGVTVNEIRRSQRGFEQSNAGKARAAANMQRAAENRANAGNNGNRGGGNGKGNGGGNGNGNGRNK
ncbi:MAG: hypothetical protein AAGM21_13610 [Pseudomonadota bacterium]